MTLTATALLVALQAQVLLTAPLTEDARLTEPAYVDACQLKSTSGALLSFEIIQSGRRAFQRGRSDWEQTNRSVRITGKDAGEFSGLNFNVEIERHYSRSAPAPVSQVDYDWPANGVAGRGTTLGQSFFPVAGIFLTAGADENEASDRQRFAAVYSRGSGNSPSREVVATGFCIRQMHQQAPLTAEEIARYLAQ